MLTYDLHAKSTPITGLLFGQGPRAIFFLMKWVHSLWVYERRKKKEHTTQNVL
jgi:hypothetical protein